MLEKNEELREEELEQVSGGIRRIQINSVFITEEKNLDIKNKVSSASYVR